MNIFNFKEAIEWIPYILRGLEYTLLIALFAAIFGVVIGVYINLTNKTKILKNLNSIYIDIFRGTPIILQLSIIYYVLPLLVNQIILYLFGVNIGFNISQLSAAILTFSLNSGAYISEVIRSGINSVDKGEIEAAESLGISKIKIYKDIILPISFKNSLPALNNELITLIKESSIVSIIGLADLMRRQQIVSSQTYMYFEPLLIVGVIYYVLTKTLSILGKKLEKSWSND
ncbi:hypothetical protein CI105_03415 [Candidatus Izimaplasma bacterium ZiA1]|uniref:amino acid ABC transporter permease n=1 Tax=Candidatus Izimoplasma sp. ZiA1 TaxID=2024899 RepID=UPI000BAA790C|nr:hypothetical protein CI105_03415 [Candidatus Izimaplasma bacterium ZiA1]